MRPPHALTACKQNKTPQPFQTLNSQPVKTRKVIPSSPDNAIYKKHMGAWIVLELVLSIEKLPLKMSVRTLK